MSARPELLEQCCTRFAEAIAIALGECGLRLPDVQAMIRKEASLAFHDLAGLRSKEEYQRLRGVTASRISLVHPEDMDLTVALINLSHALSDACERDLPSLHLHFMSLLGQDSSVLDQLPVGPEAVCIALRGICDSSEMPRELRLELPTLAESKLIVCLRLLYPELLQLLKDQGVEPASLLRSGQASKTLSGQLHETHALPGEHSGGYGGPRALDGLPEARTPDQPLGRLQHQLLQRQAKSASPGANVTLNPELLSAIMERVFIWLTERQQTALTPSAEPVNLAELHALLPAASNAALQAINLSFDVLCNSPHICAPVRASLERLRLPVAKAALIETDFLDKPDGPVRELLETVLRLGHAMPVDCPAEHLVCQTIETAVQDILRDFDRDTQIFAQMNNRLTLLESRLLATLSAHCEALLPQFAQESHREQSRSRAARAIRALCAGELPRPVRIFLERLWVRVLAAIHQHGGGEKSGAWLRALRTANQLVESVQPRQDASARATLLASLPGLLQELRAGLDAIGTPEALREKAFQSFASLHSAVIQGKEIALELGDDFLQHAPPRLDALAQTRHACSLRMPPEAEAERCPEWVNQLAVNHWVDLHVPGYDKPLRLWVAANEGQPRMLMGGALDRDFCLIFPQRWLLNTDAHAQPLPVGPYFEHAAEAALRRAPDYH